MTKRAPQMLAALLLFLSSALIVACSSDQTSQNANTQTKNASTAPVSLAPVYEGFHDIANCEGIIGWAWDKNRPDDPIKVEVYDGDVLIATVTADQFRKDLLDNQKGNGKHGFNYSISPQLKDGKPHSIRVKFGGTSLDLGNTPKQLNCEFE